MVRTTAGLATVSTKAANIYIANHVKGLYGLEGLYGYKVHPGAYVSPNLQQHSPEETKKSTQSERLREFLTNLEQGYAMSVYSAVSEELKGKCRSYLEEVVAVVHSCLEEGDAVQYRYYAGWPSDWEKEEKL